MFTLRLIPTLIWFRFTTFIPIPTRIIIHTSKRIIILIVYCSALSLWTLTKAICLICFQVNSTCKFVFIILKVFLIKHIFDLRGFIISVLFLFKNELEIKTSIKSINKSLRSIFKECPKLMAKGLNYFHHNQSQLTLNF